MRPPELRIYDDEILIDSFAGGGGASLGIQWATGRSPHVAINHDVAAITMHAANHPDTEHILGSIWDQRPREVCRGRRVALAWWSPDCFPAGTMVLARDGYRPIEEIAIGDEVLTHTLRWRKVTDTMRSVRPLVKLRGQGHPGLLVSPEHPFYARRRDDVWNTERRNYDRTLNPAAWTRAGDLDRGWYWASPTAFPREEVPPVPVHQAREMSISVDLMWLAGLYIADGWTRLTEQRAEMVITCGRHEVSELRARLAAWARAGVKAKSDELAWHERETGTAYQFSTNHRGLVEWLRQHFGHGAAEKRIPGWALGMHRTFRSTLLEGYLSGDGCVVHGEGTPQVMATTVSKALAFGLKALAQSLGYSPTMSLRTTQPDVIEGRKVNVRPAWSVRWRPQRAEGHGQTIVDERGELEWAPIRERIDGVSDAANVYNLSLEEDESYIADGIVVHNCTHHSNARGGKPRDKGIRALADVALEWAKERRPRVNIIENVREFMGWGPLDDDGHPIPEKKGFEFRRWWREWEQLGYAIEMRMLKACDYDTPTSRERLFIITRCDGEPIVWPDATNGPGRPRPWRTAAECIDWSLPCPSIFLSKEDARRYRVKRPLVHATERRIARGTFRYVIDSAEPFIVPVTHRDASDRSRSIHDLVPTVTGANRGELALVSPSLIQAGYGEREGQAPRILDLHAPLTTVVAGGMKHALVAAFLAKHYGGPAALAKQSPGIAMGGPLSAVTATDHHALIASSLVRLKGTCADGQPLTVPLGAVQAQGNHYAEVRAFLMKYYGADQDPRLEEPLHTITTKDRFGLVVVHGIEYVIVDIGMRMLVPRELFRAQGFPDSYIIDPVVDGKRLTKGEQVDKCGNSVCPPIARALVLANLAAPARARRPARRASSVLVPA